MDRNRHQADTEDSYHQYFELLQAKIREYDVEPRHIYNMDEKGFLVGCTLKTKRVFSKQLFQQKRKTAGLQDGNREWVTVLACICADGSEIDPAVIFQGKQGLRSAWVHDIEPGKHRIFFSNSKTGWTNNELGLAWLEQVFDRLTKKKARSSYRLLILDGHGSHLTEEFFDFCYDNKILIMIFPPHSTHTLQPLDVVMFAPLGKHYSTNLSQHLHRSQGLLAVKKGDFIPLFWPSYVSSFTRKNILKAFEATGVEPTDPEVILKRFTPTTSAQDEALQIGEPGDGDGWNELRKLFDAAVPDKSSIKAKRLSTSMHSMQVNNEILHVENQDLKDAVTTKRKHSKNSKRLDLQQRKEFRSKAVFWGPVEIREARARKDVQEREEEEEKLQKKHTKELAEASRLYKKQQAEDAKAERQRVAEVKKKEREAKARERGENRAQKQQEKEAATTRKMAQQAKRPIPTSSQPAAPKSIKRRRALGDVDGNAPGRSPPQPPPKHTTRGRQIKVPKKFE
jgi:hypothetical protein